MNVKKKKDQSQNPTSLTKRQRRKKLNIIKDTLHGGLGKKVFTGIGEKKTLVCSICGDILHKCTSEVIHGKIYTYCNKLVCEEKILKLKNEMSQK